MEEQMTPEMIQAEYDRLGYRAGWRFMIAPKRNMRTAGVAVVGLNPGGNAPEDWPRWSQELGNCYEVEAWDPPRAPGSAVLQRQVVAMLEIIGVRPQDAFAAQFVPFRSASWDALDRKAEALEFSRRLWRWLLPQVSARVFLCLGNQVTVEIAKLVGAAPTDQYATGWGKTKIGRYDSADGRIVVRLPHLSRYALFQRQGTASAQSEKAIIAATRPR